MEKQVKKWIGFACLIIFLGCTGWYAGSRTREETPEGLQVAATFFPLADFASTIGGDAVSVTQIVPDGAEPHEYEPSPRDIQNVLDADVVLVNGGGVDAWIDDILPDAQARGAQVVRMSDVVPFIDRAAESAEVSNGALTMIDPHAWLDLGRVQDMVRAMSDAFEQKDPAHAEEYATRTSALQAQLATLDDAYKTTFATCTSRDVLVTHDAFHYWDLRYRIAMHAITGLSESSEPSIQDIALLVENIKKWNVTTVFFESSTSSALATTLAEEVGATTDVLFTLESRTPEQIAAHATYTTLMEQNLSALSRALSCNPR